MPTPPDAAPPMPEPVPDGDAGAAEIVLRDAADGDGPGLIALIGGCFAAYPNCVLAVDAEMPELRAVASRYAALGGRYWVAARAGRVVGSIGVKPARSGSARSGPGVELASLYVAADARRRGLGARLVGRVEDEARARGAAFVELWTDTRFTDAHRLYRRLGYRQQPGVRHLFDLSNSVEYRFVKLLSARTAAPPAAPPPAAP